MKARTALLLISLMCVLATAMSPAAADPITLTVTPADSPLVIAGTFEGQPTTLSGKIRLTVHGGDVSEIQLLASDLENTKDPNIIIDRSKVSIPAGTALTDKVPRDVTLTVNDISHPGIYTGTLRFLLTGQSEQDALQVELRLNVNTPTLTSDLDKRPITISLALDGTKTTLSKNVRLTAQGGDVKELQLLSTDLHHATDSHFDIDRSKVSIPSGTSLNEGVPRDVPITVADVEHAGIYTATLTFIVPGQSESDALKVDLVLNLDGPKLEPVPADSKSLSIVGILDGNTTSFSGNVRLIARGTDVKGLQLLAPLLVHDSDASKNINSSSVKIPEGTTLSEGVPRDVRVTIDNVAYAGTYTGALQFITPGQAATDALPISLTLQVTARPSIKAVADNPSFQVVQCGIWCRIQDLVLHNAQSENYPILLENQSEGMFKITSAIAELRSQKTGLFLTRELNFQPATVTDTRVQTPTLTINPEYFTSGQYVGTLRFDIEHVTNPLMVNASINVRDDPFWVVVTLLVGIVVGRLLRSKRFELMGQYLRMRRYADTVNDQKARQALNEQLEAIRMRIEAGVDPESVLTGEISKIQNRINSLRELDYLVAKLTAQQQVMLKDVIDKAREAALNDQDNEYKKKIEEIKSHTPKGPGVLRFGGFVRVAAAGAASHGVDLWGRVQKAWRYIVRAVGWLSGHQTELGYRIAQPFLGFVLLVVLVALGMITLYFKPATFGAEGINDYLGLLFWGISSDVVQRGLLEQKLPTA